MPEVASERYVCVRMDDNLSLCTAEHLSDLKVYMKACEAEGHPIFVERTYTDGNVERVPLDGV